MGKSRLLAEVTGVARALGVRVGAARRIPAKAWSSWPRCWQRCSTIRAAARPRRPGGLRAEAGQRFWLLRDLQSCSSGPRSKLPILISIDDAQWADGGTVAALRTLPIRLSGLPIAWIFAVRPPTGSTPLTRASISCSGTAPQRLSLGPLDGDAVDRSPPTCSAARRTIGFSCSSTRPRGARSCSSSRCSACSRRSGCVSGRPGGTDGWPASEPRAGGDAGAVRAVVSRLPDRGDRRRLTWADVLLRRARANARLVCLRDSYSGRRADPRRPARGTGREAGVLARHHS